MSRKEKILSSEIKEVETELDTERILDLLGQAFGFDHPKGIAEWIKNSVDAYIRTGTSDADQYIILSFEDNAGSEPTITCLDFVGTTKEKIEADFKKWGSEIAARGGTNKRTHGGHGNGGKFYMRQMFEHSDFITYKNRLLNIFGFNTRKRYGFRDGFQNRAVDLNEAIKIAGIRVEEIPSRILAKLKKGSTGFTIVRGYAPSMAPGKKKGVIQVSRILEKVKNHPQLMRILNRVTLSVYHNGKLENARLQPEQLPPYKGFETPVSIEVPNSLRLAVKDGEGSIKIGDRKRSAGKLILYASDEALDGPRFGELNRIDILGEVSAIASYQMQEIGVRNFPQASLIWGELTGCEILESKEHDCVENDRVHLVDNEITRALLFWVSEQVDGLARQISEQQRKDAEEVQKKISTEYNEFLNAWKDKLMDKIIGQVVGVDGVGGGSGGGNGAKPKVLFAPKQPIEFRIPTVEVPLNVRTALVMKVLCPDPIPEGTVIALQTSNSAVELESHVAIVEGDSLKLSTEGRSVAVINIYVTGKTLNAKSSVSATAGPYSAATEVTVVSNRKAGSSRHEKPQTVLLSGHDPDPLGLSVPSLTLGPRDFVVYQRKQDTHEGIYWINTANPMAKKILEKYTAKSLQWRSFLFNRYLEIFEKDMLFELQKRDPDNFNAGVVDDKINDLLRKVLTAAAEELEGFLTEETFLVASTSDVSKK